MFDAIRHPDVTGGLSHAFTAYIYSLLDHSSRLLAAILAAVLLALAGPTGRR